MSNSLVGVSRDEHIDFSICCVTKCFHPLPIDRYRGLNSCTSLGFDTILLPLQSFQ